MRRIPLVLAALGVVLLPTEVPALEPVIPGLSREGLDPPLRGSVLLGELGCTSCHAAGPLRGPIRSRRAPDLSAVGARVRPEYLKAFIADPRGVKPGTTMPDVLGPKALGGDSSLTRERAADALTHYLVSSSTVRFSSQAPDEAAAAKGRELFHSIGCVACHSPRNDEGDPLFEAESAPLGRLGEKYSVETLTAFLETPLRTRPSGRMPDFHLQPGEAYQIASYLAVGTRNRGPSEFTVEEAKAKEGAALFDDLGCSCCHEMDGASPKPASGELSVLDPLKGCLSGEAGRWPAYSLGTRQVEEIRAALSATDFEPTAEQRVRASLAAFNCIACHQRGDWGGVPESRNDDYRTADVNLGETGRLPPPLTGVGAKLQRDWLRKAIASGQSLRPYMSMRMPGFGNENAIHLADSFELLDHVPAVSFEPLPADRKEAGAVRENGRALVGDKGMSCISCHLFAERGSGTMAAIDLANRTTERLRKDWFYHYLLAPVRYRPATIMPEFFPDGASIVSEVAGGDPKRQLNAIWHYLSEGRNARPPSGLTRPPMEIVVHDEAVMLRRSAQDTGKRAISVGYPRGVNLTFDAESVSLNQVWRGKFIDPVGVWTGQGSGVVRILSRARVRLGAGAAFAELADETAPWPTQTSRALGIRFKGYELDEMRRPTFCYAYGDVRITDKPVDLEDEAGVGPFLRRTLTLRPTPTLSGPQEPSRVLDAPPAMLFFRVARHGEIDGREGAVEIGRALTIRASASSRRSAPLEPLALRIRPSGDEREVIARVPMEHGTATIVLEYRWLEAPR